MISFASFLFSALSSNGICFLWRSVSIRCPCGSVKKYRWIVVGLVPVLYSESSVRQCCWHREAAETDVENGIGP